MEGLVLTKEGQDIERKFRLLNLKCMRFSGKIWSLGERSGLLECN